MDKRKFILTYLPFIIFWVIDFYSKSWFSNIPGPFSFGSLHLAYYENHGVVMGTFSKLPLILRTVFLSTIGITLVASFPLLISLVDFKTKRMIFGLSCLFSGILGNVTDRIIYGFVIDFIYFKNSNFTTPVFNIADAVQWVGYLFVAIGLYAEINYHMPDNERRRSGWINHKFQIKFCAIIFALFFAVSSIFFAFSFTFFKYTLIGIGTGRDVLTTEYLIPYSITFASLHAFLGLVVLAIGKTVSHRISGPIYSMARYLKHTLEGKHYPFKLREGDQFKELERPFTELNQEIIQLRMFLNEKEEAAKKEAA
ncbi:MAG: signal peptidase II [Bacteriovorax sp.]|nr:signal peptidase II [Bacteriovorax sp.]